MTSTDTNLTDGEYHAGSRAARAYIRANADALAEKAAGSGIIVGKQGTFARADGEVPRRILRKAFARHFRKSGSPTIARLTLEEMAAFPTLQPKSWGGPHAWLAIVTDATGRYSYAIAQEGDFTEDPKLRAYAAQGLAQIHACKMLVGDFMTAAGGNA